MAASARARATRAVQLVVDAVLTRRGQVRPERADELRRRGAVLVDVREREAWRAGHVPTSRNIPIAQLSTRHHELPTDRLLITVCADGHRSCRAAAVLRDRGLEVLDVRGGMQAWSRAGLPQARASS